ncbi:hypothetical protein LSTR_LSTR013081 [Laodelphax striatellus]|uniref:Uncharacterized protein n=1 Tax=Laodelphax striatellus TaxID=195883 RepID=A0A482XMU8_LAOST|nr:hypothetical protein LSTR_LSTR013081 [Laodelphax striatellus]
MEYGIVVVVSAPVVWQHNPAVIVRTKADFSVLPTQQDLWLAMEPVEREVIPHRHLQSPITHQYFAPPPSQPSGLGPSVPPAQPSANLQSLLSPSLDIRRIQQLAAATTANWQ